jgi:Tfp pilus assembly PilM family ATPase
MNVRDWFVTPPPDVAIEIDHGHVGAARVGWRGGQPIVTAHATEALSAGAIAASLTAANIPDVAIVAAAVARVLDQLGAKPARAALVVPDATAKVSLVRLEHVPPKAADLREIIRWQVRKAAPFPIEQAVIGLTPGAPATDGGAEFVVAVARQDVIQQYEQACLLAGVRTGLVDLATFSVINGILAGTETPSGDWLLVHVTDTYITLAVMRDRTLLFFRNRTEEAEGTLADLIHQTAMYYEDRLHGGGFSRVLLTGGARLPGGADSVRRGLEERLGIGVEPVDPRLAVGLVDRIGVSPELMDVLAPLVGILLRERKAA